jgi:polyphosphate glucokinase
MKRILTIDVGGTSVKFRIQQGQVNFFPSGRELTAEQFCESILKQVPDCDFDVVTIGYPGPVNEDGPCAEPELIGPGWVGYDFVARFGRPVKIINDAAMQAIGCYRGGRMLFLGLGTGLGTCLISKYAVVPLEVANLPYKNEGTYGDFLAQRGLHKYGEEEWIQSISNVVRLFKAAFIVEDVVLGGGNANRLGNLPSDTRKALNFAALDGGTLIWDDNCKFNFI